MVQQNQTVDGGTKIAATGSATANTNTTRTTNIHQRNDSSDSLLVQTDHSSVTTRAARRKKMLMAIILQGCGCGCGNHRGQDAGGRGGCAHMEGLVEASNINMNNNNGCKFTLSGIGTSESDNNTATSSYSGSDASGTMYTSPTGGTTDSERMFLNRNQATKGVDTNRRETTRATTRDSHNTYVPGRDAREPSSSKDKRFMLRENERQDRSSLRGGGTTNEYATQKKRSSLTRRTDTLKQLEEEFESEGALADLLANFDDEEVEDSSNKGKKKKKYIVAKLGRILTWGSFTGDSVHRGNAKDKARSMEECSSFSSSSIEAIDKEEYQELKRELTALRGNIRDLVETIGGDQLPEDQKKNIGSDSGSGSGNDNESETDSEELHHLSVGYYDERHKKTAASPPPPEENKRKSLKKQPFSKKDHHKREKEQNAVEGSKENDHKEPEKPNHKSWKKQPFSKKRNNKKEKEQNAVTKGSNGNHKENK
jgi:hypothetical protein